MKKLSYNEYKAEAKKMLREQLSAISEREFEDYFTANEDWVKDSYDLSEEGDASLLAYAMFLNY